MPDHWYYAKGDQRFGPVSEEELRQLAAAGQLARTDLAWREGMDDWVPVGQTGILPAVPDPGPPELPRGPAGDATRRGPWDPRAVAWLSVLCGPVWGAVMAAVNARRLQKRLPLWKPMAASFGAIAGVTIAFLVLRAFRLDYRWVDFILFVLLLFGGTALLFWGVFLEPQSDPFERHRSSGGRRGNWVVPTLAGIPFVVLFAMLTFAPRTLLPPRAAGPLTSRGICEQFARASSFEEAKQYTTPDLWPCLAAHYAHKQGPGALDGFREEFRFSQDAINIVDPGGEKVGERVRFRLYWEARGKAATIDGFFDLKDEEGGWRISEWYYTSFNKEAVAGGPRSLHWGGGSYDELVERFLGPSNERKPWKDWTIGDLGNVLGECTVRSIFEDWPEPEAVAGGVLLGCALVFLLFVFRRAFE